jgi:hypothetical protein
MKRPQFSVKQFLIAIAVLAVFFGLFAKWLYKARVQAEAISAIESRGGTVWYEHEISWSHGGIPMLDGEPEHKYDATSVSMFDKPVAVCIKSVDVPETLVDELNRLPDLRALVIWEVDLNNETLSRLASLRQLRFIGFPNPTSCKSDRLTALITCFVIQFSAFASRLDIRLIMAM